MSLILKTNNALLIMQTYLLSGNAKYDSYHISAIPDDAIGRTEGNTYSNVALKTIKLQELLGKGNNNFISNTFIPTDTISVSDESSWDYFSIYDQNSFTADRYVFAKPAGRTISIGGTLITNTTDTNSYNNDIINGSNYILKNMLFDLNNYCNSTKKYRFNILGEYLGSFFIPNKLSISIPANEIGNATWQMDFIGPPVNDDGDITSDTPGLVQQTTAVQGSSVSVDLNQFAYRALNTRDFYFKIYKDSNEITDRYIIGFDINVNLNWDQIPSFGSYVNNNSFTSIPSAYFWSMNDQRCSISITELYTYEQSNNNFVPLSYSFYDQIITKSNAIDKIEMYTSDNVLIYTLQKIVWDTASTEFKTDSATAIKRSGKCHQLNGGAPVVE